MPDYYDVCELRVTATDPPVPIAWQELPDIVREDSNRRQVRSRNYVNEPRSETRLRLADGYTLPEDWTYRGGDVLNYRAILGQTVSLRFTAMRDNVPDVDSNEFSITREQAFVSRLVPNRVNFALALNNATQRVYVFNATEPAINPVRHFIAVFDLDGNEQLSESLEISDINPAAMNGGAWDGSYFWAVGHFTSDGGELRKITTAGVLDATYTYTGGFIESIAYDGSHIWGLDIRTRKLRKFTTAGVEQTASAITLPAAATTNDMSGYYFGIGQYGLTYADGHWWIPQNHFTGGNERIFCCTPAGVRVQSRDVEVVNGVAGVTYNPTTDNLWWIYDRTDDGGSRYGVLEAQQI